MTNRTLEAGAIIYEGGKDTVASLDIVAKGVIRASSDYCTIDIPAGSVIGIGEFPKSEYIFTYEVVEPVSLFSYPYESEASLVALFKNNAKLLATLVAGCIRFAHKMQAAVLDTMEFARAEYARVNKALDDYPKLAISAGVTPQSFDHVKALKAPEMLDKARGWHRDFVEDLQANEAKFRKEFYSIPSIGLGIGLTVNMYALESRDFMAEVIEYLDSFISSSKAFMNHYQAIKERDAAAASSAAGRGDSAVANDESVSGCLKAILAFANPDQELFDRFSLELAKFIKCTDRYGSADEVRRLRRDLSADFYELYIKVFLSAVNRNWSDVPIGIKMFLLFGFIDEGLAGSENAAKLAAIADSIEPGSDRRVFTIFEWLMLIYSGKIMPSKNEFDLDYPAYLKELKKEGSIKEADEKRLMNSDIDRLKFEIKNIFMIGNRVTFGRITTFTPVFDKENITRVLEQSYLSAETINNEINRIRSIDHGAFYRQGVFSMPEAGVNSFFTHDEVLPYVILMPNIGTRASLWQEIDSKKRNTPARMIISIFHTETLEDTMIRLVGEFRWEMCKTEQGVHWNDVTDPSLTAMYCDYLQFYRKNSAISPEAKEKIQIALKNNANNFKKVFLADYYAYIKYESQGALRLNKHARGILFSFCPLSKNVISAFGDNPQYAQLISKREIELKQREKLLTNLVSKIEKSGHSVPDKIKGQIRQLQLG
ncbi:MAG: hypothetical protein K6E63_04770 [Lachnospiraceae bacterium]|nr:hypothetical protein [Lachnospiraceae bacterium]